MSNLDTDLEAAEEALRAAAHAKDTKARLKALHHFMNALKRCAQMVYAGTATWSEALPWAVRNAATMIQARDAIADWSANMGDVFFGGSEEECEIALERRSKLQLALDLFRQTEAAEWLVGMTLEEVERDYHDRAIDHDLVAPDWVPRSHTWWMWKDSAGGELV